MFRLIFVSVAALLAPSNALAEPISATLALTAFTVGGLSVTVGSLVSLALTLVLPFVSSLLAPGVPKSSQPDIKRELEAFRSRVPKRFVYGHTLAPATPVAQRVKGTILYQAVLLNSRHSAGGITIFFDRRAAQVASGDILDFAGSGAVLSPLAAEDNFPTGSDAPKAWIGLGDQTGPPAEILAEVPDLFAATDGFQGLTVLWLRLPAGPSKLRTDNWPRTPPLVEVLGNWSKVWDPRDAAQSATDPTTWQWSDNQALCLLDAILQNPIRQYALNRIDLLTFIDGANLADELVARKYEGGTVKRYTTNGFLAWSGGELMDQLLPLAAAGAGEIVRPSGRVAYSVGAAKDNLLTITDLLGDDMEFTRLRPGRDLPRAIKASYTSAARFWENAELPSLPLDAGSSLIGDDGIRTIDLPFVTEPTQAMRVQKIARNRLAAQKRLRITAPPSAIRAVPGNVVTLAIPTMARIDGRWRVEQSAPAAWLSDDLQGGVAMRVPMTLVQEPDDLDAWDPETDEFELTDATSLPSGLALPAPTNLAATSEPEGSTAFLRLAFDPLDAAIVDSYEWQYALTADDYGPGGTIGGEVLDGSGKVFARFMATDDETYKIRVRAHGTTTAIAGGVLTRTSPWTEITGIAANATPLVVDVPALVVTDNGVSRLFYTVTLPNNLDVSGAEIWIATNSAQIGDAVLSDTLYGAANSAPDGFYDGFGSSFYTVWARSFGGNKQAFSAYTAPQTVTFP